MLTHLFMDARVKPAHDQKRLHPLPTERDIGKGKAEMAKKAKGTRGSGNVFADLGLPNPEQELLKAQLTLQIYRIVKARKLTQAQAGEVLGIKQPHVSALMRNRAGNFSVGRLMEFLTALGQDVKITVKPTRKAVGEMQVVG